MRTPAAISVPAILILALSVPGLGACSPQPQDCASTRVFCVGLVTDFGDVNAGIANQAWLALQDAKSEGLVDRVDRIETVDTRDRDANIQTFAADGYDVIVTVGASISEETTAAAVEYPNLLFVGVEQEQRAKLANLAGLIFHEERGGFLAGVLAGSVTRTRRVAAVCEAEFVNSIRRYCEGFRAGVKYSDPTVSVSVDYRTGSNDDLFHDTTWGSLQAAAEVQQGADIVFAAGGDTAVAALEAAAAQNALVIGTETDLYTQLAFSRPRLLTCSINNVRQGVLDLLRLARQGQFPAGNFFGESGLSSFHDLAAAVPEAVQQRVLQVEHALNDGTLQMDITYDNPSD